MLKAALGLIAVLAFIGGYLSITPRAKLFEFPTTQQSAETCPEQHDPITARIGRIIIFGRPPIPTRRRPTKRKALP